VCYNNNIEYKKNRKTQRGERERKTGFTLKLLSLSPEIRAF
jgi:hypothetical protein